MHLEQTRLGVSQTQKPTTMEKQLFPARQAVILAPSLIPIGMQHTRERYRMSNREKVDYDNKLKLIALLCDTAPLLCGFMHHSKNQKEEWSYPFRYILGLKEFDNGLWKPNEFYCGYCGDVTNYSQHELRLNRLSENPCFYFHGSFIVVHSDNPSDEERCVLEAIKQEGSRGIFLSETFVEEKFGPLLKEQKRNERIQKTISRRHEQLSRAEQSEQGRRFSDTLEETVIDLLPGLPKS